MRTYKIGMITLTSHDLTLKNLQKAAELIRHQQQVSNSRAFFMTPIKGKRWQHYLTYRLQKSIMMMRTPVTGIASMATKWKSELRRLKALYTDHNSGTMSESGQIPSVVWV